VINQKEILLTELTSKYQEKDSAIQDLEDQLQDKEETIDAFKLEIGQLKD
jgi:predicted RNase H-like nuclease (RuvC/YqgF family)